MHTSSCFFLLIFTIASTQAAALQKPATQPKAPKNGVKNKTSEEKKKQTQALEKTVHITNAISEKDLGYKYGFIHYHPTEFTITANGVTLHPDCSKEVTLKKDDTLIVKYYCEFKNGKRKSSKIYTFKLKPTTKKAELTFNWHDDPRISLGDERIATLQSVEAVEFN